MFLALVYLCISIQTPDSWRTFALIYLCFKNTWCLAEMFCSCIFRDICLRDIQWSASLNHLWLDHRNMPAQRKPRGLWKLLLLHYHAKISAPRADLPCVRQNVCSVQGSQRDCTYASWNPPPFPPVSDDAPDFCLIFFPSEIRWL